MFPDFLSCWFLTGPTGIGKTAVSLELARRLDAEIVSLDSMAIYRGMDIGTAKPSPEQRATTPHHLIDIRDPTEEFSVSQYRDAAAAVVAEIRGRRRTPLFVGGTPMYLKALLRGIFDGPPADWEFRRELEQQHEDARAESLHDCLKAVDPEAARRLHLNDTRRIIRALEVHRATGRPISELQMQFENGHQPEDCRVFLLELPRHQLYQRIDKRVDAMFAAGFVDEVRCLLDRFGRLGRTACQAVGYREVIEHLADQRELAETIALIQSRTHQFVRRQETWFRSLSECRRVQIDNSADPAAIAQQIFQCEQTAED